MRTPCARTASPVPLFTFPFRVPLPPFWNFLYRLKPFEILPSPHFFFFCQTWFGMLGMEPGLAACKTDMLCSSLPPPHTHTLLSQGCQP